MQHGGPPLPAPNTSRLVAADRPSGLTRRIVSVSPPGKLEALAPQGIHHLHPLGRPGAVLGQLGNRFHAQGG